jgi:hypothetical protein
MDQIIDQSPPKAEKPEGLEEFLNRAIREKGFDFAPPRQGRVSEEIRYSADKSLHLDVTRGHDYVTKNLFYDGQIVAYLNRDSVGLGARQDANKEYTLCINGVKGTSVYSEKQLEAAYKKFVSGSVKFLGPEEDVPAQPANLEQKVEGTQ